MTEGALFVVSPPGNRVRWISSSASHPCESQRSGELRAQSQMGTKDTKVFQSSSPILDLHSRTTSVRIWWIVSGPMPYEMPCRSTGMEYSRVSVIFEAKIQNFKFLARTREGWLVGASSKGGTLKF